MTILFYYLFFYLLSSIENEVANNTLIGFPNETRVENILILTDCLTICI